MDVVLQAAIIGLLQGLTEFIPVSSSAHLELAPWIFGWEDGRAHRLAGLRRLPPSRNARRAARVLRPRLGALHPGRVGERPRADASARTRIGGSRGCSCGDDPGGGHRLRARGLHRARRSTATATRRGSRSPASWWSAAILLWLADRFGRRSRELEQVSAPAALTIGFSQALALLPGISRSGATITAGLALGLTREAAARFSFLLATPITLGAGLYGSRRLLTEAHTGVEWLAIGVGFAVAGDLGPGGHRVPALVAPSPLGGRLQPLPDRLRRTRRRAGFHRSLTSSRL